MTHADHLPSLILQILLAAAVGAAITSVFVPLAARVALALGAVDQPGGRRKHLLPIPRLGGVAVVLATGATCLLLALAAQRPFTPFRTAHNQAMMAGALLVFAIGCIDDLNRASPRLKLVVQIVAASLVVQAGGSFVLAKGLPVMHVGGLAPVLAVVWIIGVTHAFNLIDGLDGLASLCAMVALATMVASGLICRAGQRLCLCGGALWSTCRVSSA